MQQFSTILTPKNKNNSKHLVGDGVGPRRGAGDVVETVGDGGVLHDVAGVEDVWSRGGHLDLNLIADASGARAQAHPRQQPSEILGGLAAKWRGATLLNVWMV